MNNKGATTNGTINQTLANRYLMDKSGSEEYIQVMAVQNHPRSKMVTRFEWNKMGGKDIGRSNR
jgi:hypothetical protein